MRSDRGGTVALIAAFYGLTYAVWCAVGWGRMTSLGMALGDLAFIPLNLTAVALFLRASHREALDPRVRTALTRFALAYGLISLGNLLWFYHADVRHQEPNRFWPSLPYLLFYPVVVAGLMALPVAPRRRFEWWKFLLDSVTVMLGGAMAIWFFVIRPTLPVEGSIGDELFAIAYPLGGLVLIAALTRSLLRTPEGHDLRPFTLFSLGMLVGLVADLMYQLVYEETGYRGVAWTDGLYVVSYVLLIWGAEAWLHSPSPGPIAGRRPPSEVQHFSPLPYVAAGLAFVPLLWVAIRQWSVPLGPLVLGAVALTGLLLVRQAFAVQQNTRLLAERAARESEARFESLVRHSSDVIMIVEPDRTIRFASPTAFRLLGRLPDQIARTDFVRLLHPDDAARGAAFLNELLLHPESTAVITWRMRYADGSSRHVETVGTNLLNDPAIGGLVLNTRDLTEREQLENQLHHAKKMEAIGRLAGGVAHDFNNLLTSVLINSDLAAARLPPGDPVREDLKEIRRATTRAASLTSQLLAFGRKQAVEPRVLNLGGLIGETQQMLERLVGETIRFTARVDPAAGSVCADPGQLEQVLLNLVVNARDAMPNGGTLTVGVADQDVAPGFASQHLGLPPGPYVVLDVTDTGVGMDAATQSQIFEPFFTTKERGKGTGLGLAMVYGIVRQSNGAIGVESAPGRGTRFEVFLPRVAATSEAGGTEAPHAAAHTLGSGTILVVEDEEALLVVIGRILADHGYTTLTALGGEEAGRIAREHQGPIDLLLTDVVMPGATGPEVAAHLRRVRPDLQVLYMSGHAADAFGAAGLDPEGVDIFRKPFTAKDLVARVEALLGPKDRTPGPPSPRAPRG